MYRQKVRLRKLTIGRSYHADCFLLNGNKIFISENLLPIRDILMKMPLPIFVVDFPQLAF